MTEQHLYSVEHVARRVFEFLQRTMIASADCPNKNTATFCCNGKINNLIYVDLLEWKELTDAK